MKPSRLLALLAVIVLAVTACGPDEPETVTVTVSPSSLTFNAEGGTQTVSVSSNGAWTVRVDGGWLYVPVTAGNGNGSFEVTAAANDGDARLGSLTFVADKGMACLSVSQEAEVVKTVSIREVRNLYKGSDYKIVDDILIEGTVISDYRRNTAGGLDNYTSPRTIIISDGDYGLMLFCTTENKLFARGDKVRLSLKGQTLSVFNNGALQINGFPMERMTRIGTEEPVARTITLDQLLSGNYESTYVAVTDVQVKEEFIGSSFVIRDDMGDAVNTTIPMEGRDGRDFDIFTSKYAIFGDETVPPGSGTLLGIAGKYGARIQITFSSKSDYEGLIGARFSTGAHFSLSFTEYPAWGDAGSFSVVISSDVEWTASSDNSDFTVSPDKGSTTDTVWVNFTDNPSSIASRTATITFSTRDSSISENKLRLTVNQRPYEVLSPDTPQSWLELPAMSTQANRAFFTHDMTYAGSLVRNYSFWLDLDNRVSLWVAYPLYKGMTYGVTRTDKWDYDPKVPRRHQGLASGSYSTPGYDRGHQIPSADRLCSTEANEATSYFTNITPQNTNLNQGLWEKIEAQVRGQIQTSDTLYVVTGCVLTSETDSVIQFIKDNRGLNVAVPKAYFKVVLRYKKGEANGGYSAIGFWVENRSYGTGSLNRTYVKSVDEIERITGFDFFVNLKDEYEKDAESEYDVSKWGL